MLQSFHMKRPRAEERIYSHSIVLGGFELMS